MSRASDRRFGAVRARVLRLASSVKSALTNSEPSVAHDEEAGRVEAHERARNAGKMRGGAAKVEQLRAYLELDDALSGPARQELARLWDGVPADPPQVVRATVEADLGAPIEELFATWEPEPFAAASLGQVHGATLHDGTEVAVKVQYPGIAAALKEDLESNALVRELVGPGLGEGAPKEALEVVRTAMVRELDYVAEREALEKFGRAFFGDQTIKLPRAIADRSSSRVLTMTRFRGRVLGELGDATEAQRAAIATTLFRFAFGSPLRHGIVNGDPHPGNYLVLDADAGTVGFLDFGFVVDLGPVADLDHNFFLSLVHRDGEMMRYSANQAGLVPRVAVFDHAIWRDFERAFAVPFLKRGVRRFGRQEAGDIAALTRMLISSGSMKLSPQAVVLWRQRIAALAVIGSIEASLDLRKVLCELLDDGRHPTPLYERYR